MQDGHIDGHEVDAGLLEAEKEVRVTASRFPPRRARTAASRSYARREQTPASDLDLAFEFVGVNEPLAELISNAASWKAEQSRQTGLMVKDVYLSTDAAAQGARVLVFSRH